MIDNYIYNIMYENNPIKFIYPENLIESNVSHLDNMHFIVAIQYILSIISKQRDICIPTIQFGDEMFLKIDLMKKELSMSNKLIKKYSKCSKKKLLIIPISLYFPDSKYDYNIKPVTFDYNYNSIAGHANFIIIDNNRKTIEFFEPHGDVFNHPIKYIPYVDRLHEYIKIIFPFTKTYNFYNSAETCLFGVQSLQGFITNQGSCLAWTLYMIVLRVLNHNIILHNNETLSQFLHRFMTTVFTPIQLHSIINKFISYIENIYNQQSIKYNKLFHSRTKGHIYLTPNIESSFRIQQLISIYFKKLSLYSFDDCNKIFDELYTFSEYPGFHELFANELLYFMKQHYNIGIVNDFSKILSS